jgi:hypothetical protein
MPNESPKLKPNKEENKSIGDFLIQTGWSPFVFIGKSMKFFGTWIVMAFLLGAICMYVYSRNVNLPYHYSLWPPSTKSEGKVPEEMEISGTIRDWEGKLVDNTTVYVVPQSNLHTLIDGNVRLKVPKGLNYVLICKGQDPFQHASTWVSEQNKSFEVKLPPGVGRIKGKVTDMEGRPKKGKVVCISGGLVTSEICKRTHNDGAFIFEDIPAISLGQGVITVKLVGSGEEKVVEVVEPYRDNTVEEMRVPDGQDPLVTGTVKDRNGYPLVNAGVSIDGRYFSPTASDGRFAIAVPTRGSHTVEVWWRNAKVWSTAVNVTSDPFNYDIRLR